MDLNKLTAKQKEIVTTLDQPLFVAAGAGSGKTFTLTQRVVWALSEGSGQDGKPYLDSLDQVLIITFTSAAAQEIKERIRAALRAEGLEQEALAVDNAWISTIHGMCSRIIRTHALEIGVDPEFSIIDSNTQSQLLDEAADKVLRRVKEDENYKKLFDTYEASGSGSDTKGRGTNVLNLVSSIAETALSAPGGFSDITLVGNPDSCMNDLFSMKEAYGALVELGNKDKDELENMRQAYQKLERLTQSINPGNPDMNRIWQCIFQLHQPDGRKWRSKVVHETFREAKALYQDLYFSSGILANLDLSEQLITIAQDIAWEYGRMKARLSVLDNDDLLHKAAQILNEPKIGEAYASQFRLVMIDEFQDTNRQQVNMISKLAGTQQEHLCTVGDAQQSIYRFRGADVDVFINRGESVDQSRKVELDTNFRSHDDILRFVAKVCDDPDVIPDFMDLKAGRDEGEQPDHGDVPRIQLELTSSVKAGSKGVSSDTMVQVQAMQIADRFKQFHDSGIPLKDMTLLLGKMGNSDAFVRAFRQQGLKSMVTGGSTFANAPEVKVVSQLLYALSNPHDTKRGLFPLLTSELFYLDADDLALLASMDQRENDSPTKRPIDQGFFDMSFYQGRKPSERLTRARQVFARASEELRFKPMYQVVLNVCKNSGWMSRLELQEEGGDSQLANILRAIGHIKELEEGLGAGAATIADQFATWLTTAKEHPAILQGEDQEAIKIMTIHASKGLQFPVVAVAEAVKDPAAASGQRFLMVPYEDKILAVLKPKAEKDKQVRSDLILSDEHIDFGTSPARIRKTMEYLEDQAALREKARLLYVALTRAQNVALLAMAIPLMKTGINEKLMATIVERLFGSDLPEPGISQVDYGGSVPAAVRHIRLEKQPDDSVEMVEAGELKHLIGQIEEMMGKELSEGKGDRVSVGEPSQESFAQFACEPDPGFQVVEYQDTHDVFSYSSAHEQLLAQGQKPGSAGAKNQEPGSFSSDEELKPLISAEDDPDSVAVSLGSAFHEAAEKMILVGRPLKEGEIDRLARQWSCTKSQTRRLIKALDAWSASDIRKEALAHQQVHPEMPFYVKVDDSRGAYLEGAMDLVAYDQEGGAALCVDYKTGDANQTERQLFELHAMQASFYAHILFLKGFTQVRCAFVCVELVDEVGQPKTLIYDFNNIQETSL